MWLWSTPSGLQYTEWSGRPFGATLKSRISEAVLFAAGGREPTVVSSSPPSFFFRRVTEHRSTFTQVGTAAYLLYHLIIYFNTRSYSQVPILRPSRGRANTLGVISTAAWSYLLPGIGTTDHATRNANFFRLYLLVLS